MSQFFFIVLLVSSYVKTEGFSFKNFIRRKENSTLFVCLAWPNFGTSLNQRDWSGTWHGVAKTFPDGQYGDGWHKTIRIGPYPVADGTCTIWNSTFTENGIVQLTKDYRFCRGNGSADLYVDAGVSGKLAVQWINDMLISPFKFNEFITISSLRMHGMSLHEEIVMINDKTAIENMVVSLPTQSIHLIKMERVSNEY